MWERIRRHGRYRVCISIYHVLSLDYGVAYLSVKIRYITNRQPITPVSLS